MSCGFAADYPDTCVFTTDNTFSEYMYHLRSGELGCWTDVADADDDVDEDDDDGVGGGGGAVGDDVEDVADADGVLAPRNLAQLNFRPQFCFFDLVVSL